MEVTLPTSKPVWFNHQLRGFFKLLYEMPYLNNLADGCVAKKDVKDDKHFEFEGDQWCIMGSFFQRFREEGFSLTLNRDFSPSIILWKEMIGFLGEVITQNYVEIHMPQSFEELKFPDYMKRQSVELFKQEIS